MKDKDSQPGTLEFAKMQLDGARQALQELADGDRIATPQLDGQIQGSLLWAKAAALVSIADSLDKLARRDEEVPY